MLHLIVFIINNKETTNKCIPVINDRKNLINITMVLTNNSIITLQMQFYQEVWSLIIYQTELCANLVQTSFVNKCLLIRHPWIFPLFSSSHCSQEKMDGVKPKRNRIEKQYKSTNQNISELFEGGNFRGGPLSFILWR